MQKHKKLPGLASRAAAFFFALLLLSESTAASLGNSQVKIAQQPAPTPSVPLNAEQQKLYQQGVKLVGEAEELKKKGTKEGYQQAINKYQQALKIVQELKLRAEEAEINQNIGVIYYLLNEYKTALNFHNKALLIWQELNQPLLAASSLSLIGNVYAGMGEYQKAIEYFNQAQSTFREQKEFRFLAITLSSTASAYMRLGQMKNALSLLNQSLEIYRTTFKDPDKEAYILGRIAFIYNETRESDMALKYYNQALDIQRQRKDLLAQATTMSDIGSLYLKMGKYQEALDFLNKALEIQQSKGTLVDQGLTIQNIASVHELLGNYEQAIEHYKKAKSLFHEAGWTSLESQSLGHMISIYRNFLGDNQTALKYTDEALDLQRQSGDQEDEASTFNQQADIYILQGDYQLALDRYNQALVIERSIIKNPRAEARTISNIAFLYNLLGDMNSSIKVYTQALNIYKKLDNQGQQGRIIRSIGNVYQLNGRYKESLEYYKHALSLHRKQKDHKSEIITLWGIAKTHRSLNDYNQAFDAANQALELSKKYKSYFDATASLGIIGSIYLAQGDYQNALNSYKNILVDYRKAGLRIKETETLNTISRAYEFQKQHQQAINTLNEELKLRRELKDKTGEADALYLIAINQRKLGNLNAALTNIEAAIQIIENIRSNVKNSDLRTSYFATVQSYYKFKIDLLMELHKKDPSKGYNAQAIETSEASRARGLVELLTEARANIRKGANPELLAEERRIQALIDGKEKVRFEIVNSNKITEPIYKANAEKLQTEIDELLSQQKQLETKIRETSPQYANLKYPQPLNLAQIQQQLDKDTLLLQYSLGEERSFLWVVSPNSLDTYELPKKQEIEKSAINLFCLISNYSSQPPSVTNKENPCANIKTQQIDSAAKELSQLILSPVKDKLGKKRLVIVADGALQYIPFSALADLNFQPTSTSQQQNQPKNSCETDRGIFRPCASLDDQSFNYQPLLVNHEIVSLPSASTIAIQRQELANRPQAPQALAILADPVYNATDTRVTSAQNKQLQKQDSVNLELERSQLRRSTDILNRDIWTRLSGTRKEAETIFKLVPDAKNLQLLDFAANYTAATSSNLNQFRILHFATHGFVNDANPELSGIVLSLVNEQGKDIRGYLRLADLFNLDYPADLIVLSACETGLGKEIQGEGLVGLTRGLMYAGAERLLVSLWKVSDEGTSEFMQEFYKQMWQQNKSASQALRATQLKMWQQEKWRNPNYWAAFTFLGEWR